LFELNGSLGFERSTAVAAGSVRFAPWDVGSAVCPVLLELGNGGLRPCAAVAVGAVRLSGRGFDRDATGSSLLLRAGLEVRLEQRLGPLVFLVGIEGSAPIVGYRAVESGRELFRIMPIVAIPSAGVALQLP
jgi:urease beta subunit